MFEKPEAEDDAVALVLAAKQQGLLKAFDAGEQVGMAAMQPAVYMLD